MPEREELAILFADICESSRMYDSLGNEAAQSLITSVLSRLVEITAGHRGAVVKCIGDEVLCTFPTADRAVEAAMAMNDALAIEELAGAPTRGPVNIHSGLHYGEVLTDGNDVFGEAVNVAARLVALAKPRQILTTGETVGTLRAENRELTRTIDRTMLKGISGPVDICEINWEESGVTVVTNSAVIDELILAAAANIRLHLSGGGRDVEVSFDRPCVSLGRQERNDIWIDSPLASRYHARVEYRRAKFVLTDQSSNGTYQQEDGKDVQLLRREETEIAGSGTIGLGEAVDPNAVNGIRYRVDPGPGDTGR